MSNPPLRANRDYWLLLTGSTLDLLGSAMTSLAITLLAVQITGSAGRAGIITAMYGVGQWVAMLPAGALVDRWDRQRTMVATTAVGAVAMGTVPLAEQLGRVTMPHLMAVAAAVGVLGCFYSPAERAALKRVVPASQTGTALSINQARGSAANLVGSPLAGLLFTIHHTLPMLIDALTYVVAAVCAGLVRTPLPAPAGERRPLRALGSEVVSGLRWLWRARGVRDVAIGGMILNVGINGAMTVGILALQLGGTSPTALGLMESVIGATGIVAALAAPAVLQRARIGTITRAGFAAVGLVGCLLAVRISIWWIGAMMCLAVLCVAPVNAGMGAYTMRITPDEMQGRSGSASAFVSLAMIPLGTAGAGLLLEHLGARPAMAAFAVILVLGAVWTVLSRPIASIPLAGDLGEVPEVPADV
ncbi:MFS transporter [Actinomyces haliotis]|uniref:MFS transporter n=1 Tax=Actinomyces haliotis TaxID=1280843 RepID=UPI00188DDFA4|nr:MFS transporter [Actinomyces haliotis]